MRSTLKLFLKRQGLVWLVCVGLQGIGLVSTSAQQPLLSSSAAGQVESFDLDYQEFEFTFCRWGVEVERRSTAFETEPAGLGKNLLRGRFGWGGATSDGVGFIWDRDAGKLFLDLNRNLDLADDPQGIFTSSDAGSSRLQEFHEVHLSLPGADGARPFLMDLMLYHYGSRLHLSGGLRSMWAGKVTLDGQDWQMGVVVNPFYSHGSDSLLLRPWAERQEPFDIYSTLPEVFDVPEKLFLNSQAYELSRSDVLENGVARVKIRLIREQPALGDLEISGQFVDRLSLSGGEYLVLLDQPGKEVKVPVGPYTPSKIRLLAGDTEASRTRNDFTVNEPFQVVPDGSAMLVAGGPLTNSVLVKRRGRSLSLSYQLVGADGNTYQLERQDRSHPPEFAVYRNDKQIAFGKFEYG